MKFTKNSANLSRYADTVFGIVAKARKDIAENGPDIATDATLGSLFDEDGKLVAYDSVFNHYDNIDHRVKAAYASSFTGNPSFRKSVYEWATQGADLHLNSSVIATPGGSGAVSTAITTFLDAGETLLYPNIGWESYALMAQENGINSTSYNMFDGDSFDLKGLKEKVLEMMKKQERVVIAINDPCHNPTGYSMTVEEWKDLIAFLNECSKTHPCIVIDDIAYIDYSNDLAASRSYMNTFNDITDNVLICIAFSCSKTVTSYGLRCGAAIVLGKDPEKVDEVEIVMEKKARATWSNIPNAAMENFTWVVNENKDAFLKEKQGYIDLMKKRSALFLKEAQECGLETYPYKEGFFVTLVMKDNDMRDKVHAALMDEHIYTIQVNLGIRVAVCSLPVNKVYGLAQKMKEIIDQVQA